MRTRQFCATIAKPRQRLPPLVPERILAGRTAARSRAAVPAARKGLAAESARLAAELREERERQQALAEILQAVNAAADDLKPVLDTILDKATRLCDAPCGIFWVYDGDVFRPGAMHGLPEAFAEYLQQTNERPTLSLGAIRGVAPFVHDVDLAGGETYWNRSTPLNTEDQRNQVKQMKALGIPGGPDLQDDHQPAD